MSFLPPILSSSRLTLRPFRESDAALYYSRLAGSAAVTQYMLFQPHKTIAESQASMARIQQLYAAGSCYRWAIVQAHADDLIGTIALLGFDENNTRCTFAYMLGEEYWGMGYGTEVLKTVFDFAFRQLKLLEITADHFAPNAASGAAMEKAGMIYTGMVPQKYHKDGNVYDAHCYRLTREDYYNRSRS